MPIKERDVVLQGRDGGEDTIDLPITRLANVESGAEVKAEPAQGDYIPIIDSADNEQMKKFPAEVLVEARETAERALKAVQRVAYVIDTMPYQTAALTFTGEEQSPVWGAFDPVKLEISGETSAVNAGEYEAVFTPKGDYVWADESVEPRTVKWSIGRAVVAAVPSVTGGLIYTGEAQSPVWSGYDAAKLEISGDTVGTNAGSYTAAFTPKANYQWLDGTVAEKTVSWSIGRATVAAVPSVTGSLTYTGAAQSPAWANYDATKLTIGGTTSGTNAGSYSASFTPKDNYCWSDGTTGAKTVEWSIGRAVVAVPSQSGSRTYSGSAQSPAWANYDANKLTIGGTTSGTNAGSYSASFVPKANYCWSDGSTGTKWVNWTIGKAAGSLTLNKSSLDLSFAATTGTITVTRAGTGAITASSSNTNVATVTVSGNTVTVTAKTGGSVTVTVSVAGDGNYNAPANKTCAVTATWPSTTLNSNSWATIRAVSDAGQGANWWKVGDTKTITINGTVSQTVFSNVTLDVFILGFNHNEALEGGNRIHFQIGKRDGKLVGLTGNNHGYNPSGDFRMCEPHGLSNQNGWKESRMRLNVLGNGGAPSAPPSNTLMAALPSDLRAAMKSCTKYSFNANGYSYNESGDVIAATSATTDWIWLLHPCEYVGGNWHTGKQQQYAYYAAGNSVIHGSHDGKTTNVDTVWTRESAYYRNEYYYVIGHTGETSTQEKSCGYYIAPAFCV